MLEELVHLANHLDSIGLTKEADSIDSIIIKNSGLWDSMMGFIGGGKESGPKEILAPPSEEDRIAQLIRMKQNKIKALSSSEDITEHYMNQEEIEKLKREIAQLELRLSGEEESSISEDSEESLPEKIDLPDFSLQALLEDQEMPELLAAVYNSDDEKAKAYLTGSGIRNLGSFKSFLKNYLSKRRGDARSLLNEFARANKEYKKRAAKLLLNSSEVPDYFEYLTAEEIPEVVLEYNPDMSEEEVRQRTEKFLYTSHEFDEEIEELRDSFTRRRRRHRN